MRQILKWVTLSYLVLSASVAHAYTVPAATVTSVTTIKTFFNTTLVANSMDATKATNLLNVAGQYTLNQQNASTKKTIPDLLAVFASGLMVALNDSSVGNSTDADKLADLDIIMKSWAAVGVKFVSAGTRPAFFTKVAMVTAAGSLVEAGIGQSGFISAQSAATSVNATLLHALKLLVVAKDIPKLAPAIAGGAVAGYVTLPSALMSRAHVQNLIETVYSDSLTVLAQDYHADTVNFPNACFGLAFGITAGIQSGAAFNSNFSTFYKPTLVALGGIPSALLMQSDIKAMDVMEQSILLQTGLGGVLAASFSMPSLTSTDWPGVTQGIMNNAIASLNDALGDATLGSNDNNYVAGIIQTGVYYSASNKIKGTTDQIRNQLIYNAVYGGMKALWSNSNADLNSIHAIAMQGAAVGLYPVFSSAYLPYYTQSVSAAAIGSLSTVAASYDINDLQTFATEMNQGFFMPIPYLPNGWKAAPSMAFGLMSGSAYGFYKTADLMNLTSPFWDSYDQYTAIATDTMSTIIALRGSQAAAVVDGVVSRAAQGAMGGYAAFNGVYGNISSLLFDLGPDMIRNLLGDLAVGSSDPLLAPYIALGVENGLVGLGFSGTTMKSGGSNYNSLQLAMDNGLGVPAYSSFLPPPTCTINCNLSAPPALASTPSAGTDAGFVSRGSCMNTTAKTCTDYIGSAIDLTNASSACSGDGGVWSNGTACDTSAMTLIGHCDMGPGSSWETLVHFEDDNAYCTNLASGESCAQRTQNMCPSRPGISHYAPESSIAIGTVAPSNAGAAIGPVTASCVTPSSCFEMHVGFSVSASTFAAACTKSLGTLVPGSCPTSPVNYNGTCAFPDYGVAIAYYGLTDLKKVSTAKCNNATYKTGTWFAGP